MVGKKKRGHPDVEELLARPWCYYCERDFDDLKILISHQKAKHFKCERCGRRLNTAGGLTVHMNQVHKETLTNVENALPNRQGLEVEIFGMEGIPEEVAQAHNQRIIAGFYQAEAERRAASGNSGAGGGNGGQSKKPKFESPADLKKRLAEHKARKAEQAANTGSGGNTPLEASNSPHGQSPGVFNGSPFATPQTPFTGSQGAGYGSFSQEPYVQPTAAYQQPVSGPPGAQHQPQYSPPQPYSSQPSFAPPVGYQQPAQNFPGAPAYAGSPPGSFGGYQPPPTHTPPQFGGLPNRPSSLPPPPGLPQRPSFGAPTVGNYQMQQMHQGAPHHQQGGWGGNGWNGQEHKPAMSSAYPPHSQSYGDPSTNASTVDDLIAGASAQEPEDEIAEIIRRATSGLPPKKADSASGALPAASIVSAPSASATALAPVTEVTKPETTEKKSKKDKGRMVYSDNEVSPEEKMALLARYAFVPNGTSATTPLDASIPSAVGTVDA